MDDIDPQGIKTTRQVPESADSSWDGWRQELNLILTEFIRIGADLEVLLGFSRNTATTEITYLQLCCFDGRKAISLPVSPAPSSVVVDALDLELSSFDSTLGDGGEGYSASLTDLSPIVAADVACTILADLGVAPGAVWIESWTGFTSLGTGPGRATPELVIEDLQTRESVITFTSKPPRPSLRLVRTARDAEENACAWMQWMGFVDAQITPIGADGGIDVNSKDAVAQIKMEGVLTSRPVVQALFGVATAERKRGIFFSLAGYTLKAVEWADRVGLALFTFDFQGEPAPVNPSASQLM